MLVNKMNTTVDGEFQRYAVETGAYIREHFFGPDPRLRKMVEHLSDDDLRNLPRGGHDYRKLYAAYKAATEQRGAPTVILAKTIKGWTLGPDVEGRNATHQIKKMTVDQLQVLRERLYLHDEIPEDALADDEEPPYYRPTEGSTEHDYMMDRRKALDGSLPSRVVRTKRAIEHARATSRSPRSLAGSGKQEVSTTMAFTRLLRNLCRDKKFGPRVVPIIPDEARTFGMDSLFREFEIYAAQGQLYEPVDPSCCCPTPRRKDGQILEEGITEAGSMASFIAAGTSLRHPGRADGAVLHLLLDVRLPAGRRPHLGGRRRAGAGLPARRHRRSHHAAGRGAPAPGRPQPGPGVDRSRCARPTTRRSPTRWRRSSSDGIRAHVRSTSEDVFYYLTLYNENYAMPAEARRRRRRHHRRASTASPPRPTDRGTAATILFSGLGPGRSPAGAGRAGRALRRRRRALVGDLATSALREEALAVERWNRLHPDEPPRTPLVTELLADASEARSWP